MNRNLEVADGKSIMVDESGQPVLITLGLRGSRKHPERFHGTLGIKKTVENAFGQEAEVLMPLPYRTPQIVTNGFQPNGFTASFRLEQN